jgi:hypothetical protein
MKNSNDAGHSNQVANFNTLVSLVKKSGKTYNPSYVKIQLKELESLQIEADNVLKEMIDKQSHHTLLISAKTKAFDELPKFVTRIVRTLEVSEADKTVIEDVKDIVKTFRPATKVKSKKTTDSNIVENETKSSGRSKNNSNAMNRLENFLRLIELLEEIKSYEPNEEDLQVKGLKNYHSTISELYHSTEESSLELDHLRKQRDKLFYNEVDGLVVIAKKVKLYFKSIIKPGSNELKQLALLKFKGANKAA